MTDSVSDRRLRRNPCRGRNPARVVDENAGRARVQLAALLNQPLHAMRLELCLQKLNLKPNDWRAVFVGPITREAIGPDGQQATLIDTVVAVERYYSL